MSTTQITKEAVSEFAYERIESDLELLTDDDFLTLTTLIAEHVAGRQIDLSQYPPF